MNPILVGVAFAVTVGAVVAVSAREARAALVGVAVALAAAPFLGDPLPPLSTLATRVVGAALAAYLIRVAVAPMPLETDPRRRDAVRDGSRIGWPAEALLAVAAWIVGLTVSTNLEALNPGGPGISPDDLVGAISASSLATGAGLAAIVVAIVPALGSRHGLRTALGLLILVQGVLLFRAGVGGTPSDLEGLAGVALMVTAAIVGSVLTTLERRSGEDAHRDPVGSLRRDPPIESG
ncbi:MAG: hypothetical protein HYX54_06510 [Chloroflexi bacterium]|nr:hypothetical protein [Chloroflexota bacterium]